MKLQHRQYLGIFLISIMINSVWAEPLNNALMNTHIATKGLVGNWVQSRIRRGLFDEFSGSARSMGNEVADRSVDILTTLSLSPLFLPIWFPLMIFTSLFFATTLIPQVVPILVRMLAPMLKEFTPVFKMLGFHDVALWFQPEYLTKLLQPGELVERGLDVLDIPEHECRRKMFCEIGSFSLDKHPSLVRFLDLFSDKVRKVFPTYSEPLVRGIKGDDCALIYEKCKISPFAKLVNLYFI